MENSLYMGMDLKCTASLECNSTVEQFWHAIDIYNNRTHIINRKLMGVEVLLSFKLDDNSLMRSVLSCVKCMGKLSSVDVIESMQSIKGLQISSANNFSQCDLLLFTLRKLLPRNNDNFMPQLELTVRGKYIN